MSCSSVQKLYSLLDSIRVLIGGEQELQWVSALAACQDDEDDMEGSGCISEGSGGLVLEGGEGEGGSGQLPGITTDDEDFVFVDEKEQPRRRGPTPLAKFGKQNPAFLACCCFSGLVELFLIIIVSCPAFMLAEHRPNCQPPLSLHGTTQTQILPLQATSCDICLL